MKIVKTVIQKLLEIDESDLVVIEGLFRYDEMINDYKTFCMKHKHELKLFQFDAPFAVRKERDALSHTRDHVTGLDEEPVERQNESIALEDSIIIDTTRPVEENVAIIQSHL